MFLPRNWPVTLVLAAVLLGSFPLIPRQPPLRPNPPQPPALPPAQSTAQAPATGPTSLYLPLTFKNFDSTYVNPFGVIMYSGVNNASGLPQMVAAGSRWASTMLFWSTIEPNAPISGTHTYDWTSFDKQAKNAQATGVSLFVLFNGNPAWAAQYPGGPVTDTASLVHFVTVMAERYDGDGVNDAVGNPIVNYWSFYAEPDNGDETRAPGGKGWWGHNGAGYANLLAQVSPAIHGANPNAKVLIGGLAYDWFTQAGGPYVQSFLGDVLDTLNHSYAGGATHYLDAIAFHYYPISMDRWPSIREKTLEIKGILNAHGAATLSLVVPEMGYWSDTNLDSSELKQAQRLVQMYVGGLSVGLQYMNWYQVFDYNPTGYETTGLFRNKDLAQPKPAYTAYSAMTAQLAQFHYVSALSVAGVEGYVFRRLAPAETKTVVWAKTGTVQVAFTGNCVRWVDVLGNATQIVDGSGPADRDGAANGRVTLDVGVNAPIYVGACS